MKARALLPILIIGFASIQAIGAQEIRGSLVHQDEGDCDSIAYETATGDMLNIFDVGQCFDSKYEKPSPDKSYTMIGFSQPGMLEDDSAHTKYLCAIVRMSDGCVVTVEEGEICGGEWSGPGRWGIANMSIENFDSAVPKIGDVYRDYATGHKDRSQVSDPRILAYLTEGTTFDNLLVCNPLNTANRKSYSDLLALLRHDGDTRNALKVETLLGASNNDLKKAPVTGTWVTKMVLPKKAFLYSQPSESGISRAYLIQHDLVLVPDDGAPEPFVRIRYLQKNGRTLEKWMRCEDIGHCKTID